jgi:endonuclease YncB( thermonuclease family)
MKKFIKYQAAVAVLIAVVSIPSLSFAWSGKAVSVSEGDTLKVLHDGKEEIIRLYGIDTPDSGQSAGMKAKDLTSALVAGRNIEVESKDADKYGRTIGLVRVDGAVLNEMIVRNGYAWVYHQYCDEKFCSDWVRIEGEARRQKKGMWNDEHVVPPWEWRDQDNGKTSQDKPPELTNGPNARATSAVDLPPAAPVQKTPVVKLHPASPARERTFHETSNNELLQRGPRFKCDGRTYCSQMTSCEEATFFLQNCPGVKMDGNNDGVPCEKQWCR